MYKPRFWKEINLKDVFKFPNTIKQRNNIAYDYWERALFQRAISVLEFDFDKVFKGEEIDFILYSLFKRGYGVVAYDDEYGILYQPCTLKGYNLYYQPTSVLISNPLLSKEFEIHENCELLKLTPDYIGIWDIISYYAGKLAELDNAINISLVNSKYSFVLSGKTKNAVSTLKKIMDKINQGEPSVYIDSRVLDDVKSEDSPFNYLDLNVKERYILDMLLKDFQTILNNFDNEIGIPTIPYEKKERLVEAEAKSKNIESVARCTTWVESLTNSFELINEMFDTNMSVRLRYLEDINIEEKEEQNVES